MIDKDTWECPECGSSDIEYEYIDDKAKLVCADCHEPVDSKSKDWEYWYPCTECGSTRLKQTQVAIVLATEGGNYGGEDDPDYDETIECAECGTLLK